MSRVTAQIAPTAYTPAAPPSVTLSTTSATVLAAATTGKTRTVLRIQNSHASNTIYLREDGGVAATTASGFHLKLGPGQGWDWQDRIPQGLITGIADGAGTIVAVTYAEV
jgi:hypothetical protein